MPSEHRQFRILFRDFLCRLVDLDLLSPSGDTGRLLGQIVALLVAFDFTFLVVTMPKYLTGSVPQNQILTAARAETEFLFATTMAIAGLLAVLAWNLVLPDRRDCAILGVLPVRLRTIFLARIAAIGAALGGVILAINVLAGLCYPFLLTGGVRGILAYWAAMAAMGLFVCSALLAVQGVAGLLLTRRAFLRVSGGLQIAAFFAILATYFLRPPLRAGLWTWLPSNWFYACFEAWRGAPTGLVALLAARALWGLAIAAAIAALAFGLAFARSLRRVLEQPDIAPADRSRPASQFVRFLASRPPPQRARSRYRFVHRAHSGP